jgi:acetyltransferase
MTDPEGCAEAIIEVSTGHNKPILTSWMGGASMLDAIDHFNRAGLSTFPTPERAVTAFLNLVNYRHQKSEPILVPAPESQFKGVKPLPTEVDAKQLLSDYLIDVVPTKLANSEEDAIALASEFGFPVAVKIASPQITHKSDFGGVCLNLQNEEQAKDAYRSVIAAAHKRHPQDVIMGVSVQPMIDVSGGYELIAGIKRDPVFGPVVMVGAGGINAEVFKDVAFELAPLDDRLAASMLKSLESWPILNGFRGQPVLNIEAVVDALIKLSHLALAHPEIKELDINPLLVTPDQAIALDARIKTG